MNAKNIHGFSVTRKKNLPELNAELIQMYHDKTGLELVWLKRDEENKTFGIAFDTLPWDDTGVFHILEHSVLCGSEKYPVKEPFVELMKNSMNTFLNAMTFSDKTFYPVSSRNDKDFVNLMRVYLDAVFCPLIYTRPEIFYQEGWHYELDENGKASYKGVVFNEMKGVFANADKLTDIMMKKLLFPDSPYQYVSGGDPGAIPDLTYEEFLDAHRYFYAPSNAYVFLDGEMNIDQVLTILDEEYLCRYEKAERIGAPMLQKPVSGEMKGCYEIPLNEKSEGKLRIAYGKVIGTFDEREKLVAMYILSEVLCGTNQASLSKAILAEGLAEEVYMGINDGVLQPWLILELKNIHDEKKDRVEEVVIEHLNMLVQKGLDHSKLNAVLANLEFRMREKDYGYYPQGLILGFNVLESWIYGGSPEANLEIGDLFLVLKKKMEEGYFEELIQEVLLNNPHSAKVVLYPSYTAGEKRRNLEKARLDTETSAWTSEERKLIRVRQDKLTAWQNSTDAPEMLEGIPRLSMKDISKEPEQIPTEVITVSGVPVIKHEITTGGIVYTYLYFDADSCTEEELSQLSFLCSLLGQVNTVRHQAEEIINRIRLLCGGFSVYPVVYTDRNDFRNMTVKLCVSFSTLKRNYRDAWMLVKEIMTESVFEDEMTRDILRQSKLQMFQGIVMNGNSVGLGRIAAQISSAGVAEEYMGGIAFYEWLKQQDENWNFEELQKCMTNLMKRLINKNGLTVSVTGDKTKVMDILEKDLLADLPRTELWSKTVIKPWGKRREGFIIPSDVSFAVMGGNVYENGGTFTGHLQLASQIVSLGYLWNTIRVQGGAYGTGMVIRDTGLTACYSYRDPSGAKSLEDYCNCGNFLREFCRETTDFTGYKIGTISRNSPLMTSKSKAQMADRFYFSNISWEERCLRRRELMKTTDKELQSIANILERTINEGSICIVGGAEQLKKCKNLEKILTL